MKKVSFILAVAAAAGLASCTSNGPKADLQNEIDTLSYAFGMAQTETLPRYLMSQGIDSTLMVEFMKGFNEGSSMLSDEDRAYITGLQIGHMVSKTWVDNMNQQLFGNDSTMTVSRENLLAGFIAGVSEKHDAMTLVTAQTVSRTKMDEVREKSLLQRYADNKKAGEDFLAENKTKEGVVTTASGLQYKILKKGNGPVPTETSRVEVNYKGTLVDGTEFDSSYKRKDKDGKSKPASFMANRVVKGWTEALTMMPVGSKWELYIPQELAYGSREMGNIKPFSTLIFEVELISTEETKK